MAFFNQKMLLKTKYFRNRTTIIGSHLLPTNVTVAHFDEKCSFWPNLALQKWKKWIFGQIWTYQIWLHMVGDSHSTHQKYLISRFLGEFNKLKKLLPHYVRRPSSLAYLLMWQFVTTQTKLKELLGTIESPWNWKIRDRRWSKMHFS